MQDMKIKLKAELVDIHALGLMAGLETPPEGILNADVRAEGNYLSPLLAGAF